MLLQGTTGYYKLRYYSLLQVTTGVTRGYYSLLASTTGKYRYSRLQKGYFKLLQVIIGNYMLLKVTKSD